MNVCAMYHLPNGKFVGIVNTGTPYQVGHTGKCIRADSISQNTGYKVMAEVSSSVWSHLGSFKTLKEARGFVNSICKKC